MITIQTEADLATGDILTDKMRILLLSLRQIHDWDDCKTELEKQLFLIKNMETMDRNSKAYSAYTATT